MSPRSRVGHETFAEREDSLGMIDMTVGFRFRVPLPRDTRLMGVRIPSWNVRFVKLKGPVQKVRRHVVPPGKFFQEIGDGMPPSFPAVMLHRALYSLLCGLLGREAGPLVEFCFEVVPGVVKIRPSLDQPVATPFHEYKCGYKCR